MNKSGIYKIYNSLNNRIYIGSAVNLEKRKKYHFHTLKKNDHHNQFLQRDFNKIGEKYFLFEVLLYTDCKELLLYFEQNYLDQYYDSQKNCYNIYSLAGSPFGMKHSIETKKKFSETRKGEKNSMYGKPNKWGKHSLEAKQKISDVKKGVKRKPFTDECKQKMSAARKGENAYWYGKKLSDEHKQKMSNSNKGKYVGEKGPNYDHTMYHFINEKMGLEEYCTQYELRKKHCLQSSHLSYVISGKRKLHKGWKLNNDKSYNIEN